MGGMKLSSKLKIRFWLTPYLQFGNSGNYVELLILGLVTNSDILPLRALIPGIVNSGIGICFLELGAYKVPQVCGH